LDALAARAGVELRRSGYLPPQAASDTLSQVCVIALPFHDGASQRSGSLLAALQTGRPVVTTTPRQLDALGALRQLPQLMLAPARDPLELAKAIEVALAQEPAAAPLPDEHRWDVIAAQHVELYTSVLARRRESA
jgi:hypothetical protein